MKTKANSISLSLKIATLRIKAFYYKIKATRCVKKIKSQLPLKITGDFNAVEFEKFTRYWFINNGYRLNSKSNLAKGLVVLNRGDAEIFINTKFADDAFLKFESEEYRGIKK